MRRVQVTAAAVVLTAIVTAGWLMASPDAAKTTFVDEIEVKVLNIEAVVVDRDGVRAGGLSAGDFTLLVDGEQVPVEYFTEVRGGRYVDAVERYPEVVPDAPSGTNILVFIDEFFAIARDKKKVLNALKERIPGLAAPDRLAIVAWNGKSLDIITDWTSSEQEALAAVDVALKREALGLQRTLERRQYSTDLEPDSMMETRSQMGASSFDRHRLTTQERSYARLLADQLQGTTGAATAAMRGVADPGGRKVMLLLAGGWPADVGSYVGRSRSRAISESSVPGAAEIYGPLADTANLLGYTLYPVDVPGFMQTGGGSAEYSGSTALYMGRTEFFLENELHRSLQYMATETGGFALINGDRIRAMDEVRADIESFYWLGFTPTWARDDESHSIEIRVDNPDLQVRARTNYLDLSPQTQITMAVQSSLLFGTARGSSELSLEVVEVSKPKRSIVEARVKMTIPISALTLVRSEHGYHAQTVIFMAAVDKAGGRSEVPAVPLNVLAKTEPGPNDILAHEVTLKLHRKTVRLSVALYDVLGDKTFTNSLVKQ